METTPPPRRSRRLVLAEVLATERAAAALLVVATLAAVAWASVDPAGYAATWQRELAHADRFHGLFATPAGLLANGAMVAFFLAVGLELGREHATGEGSLAAAGLPSLAALGGMAGAALAYLAVVAIGGDAGLAKGWPVPTATDVAFSIGALSLAGRYAPASLRPFLLTLAVADDLLAVGLLAVVGPHHGSTTALLGALAVLGLLGLLRRQGAGPLAVLLGTGLLFVALAAAGVEPILAGAAGGLCISRSTAAAELAAERLERVVAWISSYLVLPLFVLSAAGVALRGNAAQGAGLLLIAIVVARSLGKAGGIVAATTLGARSKRLNRPAGVGTRQLWGLGLLCGVGLTVPLLFAGKVFAGVPADLAAVQLGLLAASLLAGLLGLGLLRSASEAGGRGQG